MRRFAAWVILSVAYASVFSHAWAIGPSFDCSKANTPGQQLICADADLSREDLAYAQTYYVLRQKLDEAGRRSLKLATIAYENQALQSCGVPLVGQTLPYPYGAMATCLGQAYERRRTSWIAGLNGPAAEEALRPIELHVSLQDHLQKMGYLPPSGSLDGVYGTDTRDAIERWQRANNRPDTGFLSDSDASMMLIPVASEAAPRTATAPEAQTQTWSDRPATTYVPPSITQPSSSASVHDDDSRSSSASGMSGLSLFLILIILGSICLYFLPAMIGSRRQISSSGALFFVNFFFGWTVLGWLFCMLWAATGATRGQDAFYNRDAPPMGHGESNPTADPAFREAYARERARLDREAGV